MHVNACKCSNSNLFGDMVFHVFSTPVSQAWGLPKYVYSNQAPAHFCKPVEERRNAFSNLLGYPRYAPIVDGLYPNPTSTPTKR